MIAVRKKLVLAAGFGESLALIRFQQEMRRKVHGFARYCGIGHGGHDIAQWITDGFVKKTISLVVNTTASSTTATTASTASLTNNVGVTGTGISWGTQAVIVNGTTLTLSAPATATGSPTLEFSDLTQDIDAFEGLKCHRLLLFLSQGANDIQSAAKVATYPQKLDVWIALLKAAVEAQEVFTIYNLPYHTPAHSDYPYYAVGQPGYNLRAAMTAKALAEPSTFAIYNSDALNRTVDGVHLDTQADDALLAGGMWTAMKNLIF